MLIIEYRGSADPSIDTMHMGYLCAGRLDRDAGDGGKEVTLTPGQTSMKAPLMFIRGTERSQTKRRIRRVLREGQRRSDIVPTN